MSRRAWSPPSVRTLRHGTGSRRRLRQHSAAVTPAPQVSQLVDDARRSVLLHHVLGFLWARRNPQTRGSEQNIMSPNASVVATQNVTVKITPNDKGNPPGKLADAEIHFVDGVFAGLKLIGFAIWERRTGAGRNVTFPARQYSVNGERRSFALLRPRPDPRRLRGVRTGGVTDHPTAGAPSGAPVAHSKVFGGASDAALLRSRFGTFRSRSAGLLQRRSNPKHVASGLDDRRPRRMQRSAGAPASTAHVRGSSLSCRAPVWRRLFAEGAGDGLGRGHRVKVVAG